MILLNDRKGGARGASASGGAVRWTTIETYFEDLPSRNLPNFLAPWQEEMIGGSWTKLGRIFGQSRIKMANIYTGCRFGSTDVERVHICLYFLLKITWGVWYHTVFNRRGGNSTCKSVGKPLALWHRTCSLAAMPRRNEGRKNKAKHRRQMTLVWRLFHGDTIPIYLSKIEPRLVLTSSYKAEARLSIYNLQWHVMWGRRAQVLSTCRYSSIMPRDAIIICADAAKYRAAFDCVTNNFPAARQVEMYHQLWGRRQGPTPLFEDEEDSSPV